MAIVSGTWGDVPRQQDKSLSDLGFELQQSTDHACGVMTKASLIAESNC